MLEKEIIVLEDYAAAVNYVQKQNNSALRRWSDLPYNERITYVERLYQDCQTKYSMETDQLATRINADIAILENTISYIQYLDGYHDYIRNIETNSETLSNISIYQNNSKFVNNIIKTRKDFYGLQGIVLTPVIASGYIAFLHFKITDFFAALIALLSLTTIKREPIHRKKNLLTPIRITVISTFVMYVGNFILTDHFVEMPQMTVTVQSMESFKTCPYMINAGFLAISTVIAKTLGCLIVLFVSILIFSVRGKKKILVLCLVSVLLLAEVFFAMYGSSEWLKEINVLSLFSFERFFMYYMNLEVFGILISRLPVFIIFVCIVFVFLAIISVQSISKRMEELTREAEQEYYDEINRRYLEGRKIRHDINNHLLAINTLIETGNVEQAKRYISEVSEQLDLVAMPVKTGRDVLDALLLKKTEQATEKGAQIVFEINAAFHDCTIADYDLCTIFGNILDNAIEAVNAGDKILVSIDKQHDMFYISCENTFYGELKRKGDKILSTKKEFGSHGFGLTRIRDTAKHYGGDVSITAENGVFRIEILMNIK
ncbi:MAG: GHKL domain-containing protein [Clostridia bacterium]|nr:GHKL domain-containing protein [Clostridia bacterium]